MRRRLVPALLIALLALSAGAVSACGGSESPVLEGQPLEVGDLTYYVQLTRFLNPSNPEDAAYLAGQPAAPKSDDYLAVFLRVDNKSDQAQNLADHFSIVDTRGNVFEPIPSDSDFALQPGADVPADSQYPPVDSPAYSGPVKGSYLLFALPVSSEENRPLNLQIPAPDGSVEKIELDL